MPHTPAPPSSMSIVYQHTVSPVCVLHLWYIRGWAASWGALCLWLHLPASRLPAVSRRSHILGVFPQTTQARAAVPACCSFACLGVFPASALSHSSGLILPSTCLSLLHVPYRGAKGEAAGVEHAAALYGKRCGISAVCMWGSSSSCYPIFHPQRLGDRPCRAPGLFTAL
jgi:hypothetical protein